MPAASFVDMKELNEQPVKDNKVPSNPFHLKGLGMQKFNGNKVKIKRKHEMITIGKHVISLVALVPT